MIFLTKNAFVMSIVIVLLSTEVFSQNSPIYIWGGGLDGTTYQKTGIYSDLTNGLLFEAPLTASSIKLPIEFNWRGGGVAPLYITGSGKVGIGTNSPFSASYNTGLHISRGAHSSLFLGDPGNHHGGVIQTSDNRHRIFIGANFFDDESLSWRGFDSDKGTAGISVLADEGGWGTSIDLITSRNSEYKSRINIDADGNVGIGTVSQDYRLTVNGKIKAEEVKVVVDVPADYVFGVNYPLLPLVEVEKYVNENSHLPGMPSAGELKENGWQIGEMSNKLLEKIEELTLYVIEIKKENEDLKKEVEELKHFIKR